MQTGVRRVGMLATITLLTTTCICTLDQVTKEHSIMENGMQISLKAMKFFANILHVVVEVASGVDVDARSFRWPFYKASSRSSST